MLQEGDSLSLEDGREVPIQSIKIVDYNYYIFVYNFEVKDFHTYYVCDSSVLVHNNCNEEPRKFSTIKDVTKKGSIKNFETNVTMKEFCETLETNGFEKKVVNKGVIVYTKDWTAYSFLEWRTATICIEIYK